MSVRILAINHSDQWSFTYYQRFLARRVHDKRAPSRCLPTSSQKFGKMSQALL